jgi:hypothetical protein
MSVGSGEPWVIAVAKCGRSVERHDAVQTGEQILIKSAVGICGQTREAAPDSDMDPRPIASNPTFFRDASSGLRLDADRRVPNQISTAVSIINGVGSVG